MPVWGLFGQCFVVETPADAGSEVYGLDLDLGEAPVVQEPTYYGESTLNADSTTQASESMQASRRLSHWKRKGSVSAADDVCNTEDLLGAVGDEPVATSAEAPECGLSRGSAPAASGCEPRPLQNTLRGPSLPPPVAHYQVATDCEPRPLQNTDAERGQAAPCQPAEDAPAEPTCYPADIKHFKVVLRKKHERGDRFTTLGLSLSKRDVGLAIVAFAGSGDLAMQWNKKHPKQRLQKGDIITAVNGVDEAAGADALLAEVNSACELILCVSRVVTYSFSFQKTKEIGLDVSMVDGSVVGIHEGIVQEYNSRPSSQWMVAHGDMLVEVGGVTGSPQELMRLIRQSSGSLTMKFKRWLS